MEVFIYSKTLKVWNLINSFMLIPRNFKSSANISSQLDSHMLEKRKQFLDEEKKWEAKVDLNKLTYNERKIYECHKKAVERRHFTYDDPFTDAKEFTRLRHFYRGVCCGNACRHCIYNYENVPAVKKKNKRYNSAFWVSDDDGEEEQGPDDLESFSLRKPKSHP